MIDRLSALPTAKKMKIAAITGILLLCAVNIAIFLLLRARSEAADTQQSLPIQFEYCGAAPQELCVLSFGRDGFGNAIINFFVPDKINTPFYLIVKKSGAESRYECRQNSEIKTSVYCSGGPLSLKQTIEVNIFANEDDRLLATGKFFIEAFLISSPHIGEGEVEPTATIEEGQIEETATEAPTETPIDAYPYP